MGLSRGRGRVFLRSLWRRVFHRRLGLRGGLRWSFIASLQFLGGWLGLCGLEVAFFTCRMLLAQICALLIRFLSVFKLAICWLFRVFSVFGFVIFTVFGLF